VFVLVGEISNEECTEEIYKSLSLALDFINSKTNDEKIMD
jgi:hypothetical protein